MTDDDEATLGADSDSSATLMPDGSAPSHRSLDPSSATLPLLGDAIGRFEVVRMLGRGGMGAVFLADDPQLGRQVAIKLVATGEPGLLDSVATARLIREAQAMARVTHPNLVHVYDVGSVGDRVWIAMEYVPGRTLKQWLADHADASWEDRLEPFIAAGRGVAAAHRANLVHRDFKPDNVIVGDDGIVRVLDFGLARDVGGMTGAGAGPGIEPASASQAEIALAQTSGPLELGLTRTGALVGTPAYMSPEQLRGEPTDARTDVFSFCVAVFEAVHGRRPFAADNYAQLVHVVLGDTPIQAPSGRVPAWLNEALLRGLARDRADRWPSLDELLAELDPSSPAVSMHAQRRSPRRWLVGGGVVIGIAISVVLAIVFFPPRKPPTPPELIVTPPAPTVALTPAEAAAKEALAMVLISPNGAERLNRAQQYVEDHGEAGGLGRLALAESVAATELWSASCATERMSLCLVVDEPATGKPEKDRGCFSPAMPAVTVTDRDPTQTAKAQQFAADALDHALAGGQPDPDDAIVGQAWNTLLPASQSILADVALESYLQLAAPEERLSKAEGTEPIEAYLVRKQTWLDEVVAGYEPVIRESTGFAKVVALSRRGLARQALYDSIARMPIPRSIVGDAMTQTYCDGLTKVVRPIANLAVEDFRACIDEAMRARLSSEYVELCEDRVEALEKLDRARVRETIRAEILGVQACYHAGLVNNPELQGEVEVRFTIGPDGKVSDSMLVDDPKFPDPEVATCIEQVIRKIEFPKPPGGGTMTVSYPFNLEPG